MTKKEAKIVKGLMEKPRKEWVQLSPCAPWHGSVYALYRDGYVVCRSYDTAIAMLTPKCEVVRLWDGYSKTSMGHLSTWCMKYHLPIINGKTWDNMTVGRKYSFDSIDKLKRKVA